MLRPLQPPPTQRWVVALAFAVAAGAAVGVAAPSAALAQTTLVVRGDGRSHASIAVAADDALFDATGSSAHRVEVTLEDLALAAGCTTVAGATLASIGALVSGVIGLNAMGRADVFRQSDRMRDMERLAAAEEQRDVALGTATAFTVVGAALALTGLVLALADSDTRVAAIPLADGALLELRGAF